MLAHLFFLPFCRRPTLLPLLLPLLFKLLLPFSDACLTLQPPHPPLLRLRSGRASTSFKLTACTNSSLSVTADPNHFSPTVSLSPLPLSNRRCRQLRATLTFRTLASVLVTFNASPCSAAVRIQVSGLIARHLPERRLVTHSPTTLVSLPAPHLLPAIADFDVYARCPSCHPRILAAHRVASKIKVALQPPLDSVIATLGGRDRSGNLHVISDDDGSDQPREEVQQTLTLSLDADSLTAQFRIVHASLVATVHELRVWKSSSSSAEKRIIMVVSRAAADLRRLVIDNSTIAEDSYSRNGSEYLSSFIVPAYSPGIYSWHLELVRAGKMTRAVDLVGQRLEFHPVPKLDQVTPSFAKPGIDGLIIVSGTFDDSIKVLIDGEPLSDEHVLHITPGEARLRIPRVAPSFNGTVGISAESSTGEASNTLLFRFDPDAIDVSATVMHAAEDAAMRQYMIPLLCGHSSPPTVFATAKASLTSHDPPIFTFSVRKPAAGTAFELLSAGLNALVTLAEPDLFIDSVGVQQQSIAVHVHVSQNEREGETILFISRRLRKDVVGFNVFPHFGRARNAVVLEADIMPLRRCRTAPNLETDISWSINGTRVVLEEGRESSSVPEVHAPRIVGLGRTLLVPGDYRFSYSATVTIVNSRTGKVMAQGSSSRRAMQRPTPPLRIFLNGGVSSLTLPISLLTYEIRASSPDVVTGKRAQEARYAWSCKVVGDEPSQCPRALFPVEDPEQGGKPAFNISTRDRHAGLTVEYALTASMAGFEGRTVRLQVTLINKTVSTFPSSKVSAGSVRPRVALDGALLFSCYESLILAMGGITSNMSFNFALFSNSDDTDHLKSESEELLISHEGYWSPHRRQSPLFGLKSKRLKPGTYRLIGTLNDSVLIADAFSWLFRIERCSLLISYDVPVTSGEAGITTYHIGASSVPPSNNLFFFAAKRIVQKNDTAHEPGPNNYLTACTGSQACSFSISVAGRYTLQAHVYDPRGKQLLSSKTLKTTIDVSLQPGSRTAIGRKYNNVVQMRRALSDANEGLLLQSIISHPTDVPLAPLAMAQAIEGLSRTVANRILVGPKAGLVIEACVRLLLNSSNQAKSAIIKLRLVVQNTIRNVVSTNRPSSRLKGPLILFYRMLILKSLDMDHASTKLAKESNENMLLNVSRRSAEAIIPLLLASGRECGYLDRLIVPFPSRTRFNISAGTPEVMMFDDYRIGVTCFDSQISLLPPSPSLTERCSETKDGYRLYRNPQVIVSSEQPDFSERSGDRNILYGPIVRTTIHTIRESNDVAVFSKRVPKSPCMRMRIPIHLPEDIAKMLARSTSGNLDLECSSRFENVFGLRYSASDEDEVKIMGLSPDAVSTGPDGRIVSYIELKPPTVAQMSANGTQLRACALVSDIQGRRVAGSSVLLISILALTASVLLVIALIVVYLRYAAHGKYSVPSSVAPWHSLDISGSMTSRSLASLRLNSEEQNHDQNEWATEYKHIEPPQVNEGQPGPLEGADVFDTEREFEHSSGLLDRLGAAEWEPVARSPESSLLTGSPSYTSSSGDLRVLSSSEPRQSARRLQPGMHALPDMYAPSRAQSEGHGRR